MLIHCLPFSTRLSQPWQMPINSVFDFFIGHPQATDATSAPMHGTQGLKEGTWLSSYDLFHALWPVLCFIFWYCYHHCCATTHKIIMVKIAAIAIRCIFMASTLVEMFAGTNITIDFGIPSSLCKTAVSTLQTTYFDYQHTRMVTAPICGHILLFLVVQPS